MKAFALAATLSAVLLATAVAPARAEPAVRGHQVSVTAADVQQYLGGHFPQHHDALGGLLQLTVSNPHLTLPPGSRLQMAFDLALATAGGAPTALGNVNLSSGLRYDTARQGFFLDQPSIESFTPASAGGKLDRNSRDLLNVWLADYARKEPIYRLDPALAQLMGALQVESASVQDGRLVVNFNQDVGGLLPAGALSGH